MPWRNGYARWGTLNGVAPQGMNDCWGRPLMGRGRGAASDETEDRHHPPLEGVDVLLVIECKLRGIAPSIKNFITVLKELRAEGLHDDNIQAFLELKQQELKEKEGSNG